MSHPDRVERRRVWFSGRVQGVGFRATTVRVAANFPVVGYVQNLPDGRVLAVIEGGPAQIDAFLESLRETMGRSIRSEESLVQDATGDFSAFEVRH